MKKKIRSYLDGLKKQNQLKYLIAVVIFLLIIGFFDENSLIKRAKYDKEIHSLKNEIKKYQQEYDESTKKLKELYDNPDNLERIARENYLMKKQEEDIYVFE